MSADITTLGLAVDSSQVRRAEADLDRMARAGDKAADGGSKMENAWGKVRGVLAGLALGATIHELVQMADAMTLLDARLKNVAGSQQAFAELQSEAYRIAQKSNAGIAETVQLMTRLHEPVKRLGGTTRETSMITEAFAASLRVGGASAQEAAAATLQFAQAMGSGKLQGDEFKSIAEASPRFMKALADGMGTPIEKLKEMGSEGKLTADVVGNALIKSLGSLRTEMTAIPDTVGGAFTRLMNDVKLAVNDINSRNKVTLGIADVIESVRQLIPVVKDELSNAVGTVAEWWSKNKTELGAIATTLKGVAADMWEIVKAGGAVAGAIIDIGVQTGAWKTMLEAVRILLAGFVDGVEIIAASFAGVGSSILQFVMTPMIKSMELAKTFVGFFDKELASQMQANIDAINDFTQSGERYADRVFNKFADGKSRLGALNEELGRSTAMSLDQQRALERAGNAMTATTAKAVTLKGATAELSKEQKKLFDSYGDLTTEILEHMALLDKEAATGRKLNDAEEAMIKFKGQLRDKFRDLKPELVTSVEELLKLWDAKLKAKDAGEELVKALEKENKARIDLHETQLKDAQSTLELAKREQEENETAGMTTLQIKQRGIARLDEAIAVQQQKLAMAELNGEYSLETIAAEKTLEALVKLRDARQQGIVVQMAQDAKAAWAEVGEFLESALLRAFEGGAKSGFDYIKSAAKQLVLKMTVQMLLGGLSGNSSMNFLNALAGNGATGGSGGGGLNSYMQLAGMAQKGWGTASSWFSGLGSGGTSAAAANTWAGGFGGAVDTWGITSGVGQGAFGTTAATGMGTAAEAAALNASGAGTAAASGVSAIPIIGWIIAGLMASIEADKQGHNVDMLPDRMLVGDHERRKYGHLQKLGFSDKWANILSGSALVARTFGHKASSTGFGIGTVQNGDFVQSTSSPRSFGANTLGNTSPDEWLQEMASNVTASIGVTAGIFGGGLKEGMRFGALTDNDRKGKVAALMGFFGADNKLLMGTQTGSGAFVGNNPGNASKIEAGDLEKWIEEQMPVLIVQGLQQSDLSARFKEYFSSVAAEDLDPQAATDMLATATAVVQLADTFGHLEGPFQLLNTAAVSAIDKFAEMSGGLDKLGANIGTYYSNFYSETERTQDAWDGITKAMNEAGIQTIPKTKDAFRDLVEGLDLNTIEGQKAFTALMQVSGAFAALVDNADAKALEVSNTKREMEIELLEALGKDQEALALRREDELAALRKLDPSLVDLKLKIYAAEDAAKSLGNELPKMLDVGKARDAYKKATNYQANVNLFNKQWESGTLAGGLQSYVDGWWGGKGNVPGPTRNGIFNEWMMRTDLSHGMSVRDGIGDMSNAPNIGGTLNSELEKQRQDATYALIDALNALRDSWADYVNDLDFSSLSTLGPEAQYYKAKEQFDQITRQAEAGDAAAREQVLEAADRFLKLSQGHYGSTSGFVADSDSVKARLDVLIEKTGQLIEKAEDSVAVQKEGATRTIDMLDINNELTGRAVDAARQEVARNVG